jgi:twinkle protein
MKIQSSNTKQLFNYDPPTRGNRSTCPECSHKRKNKKDPCLNWDAKQKRGYCHNCSTTFFEYNPHEEKQYTVPAWKNITELSDRAVKWFESRMIRQEILQKMKVYSDTEFMPQLGKESEVICFPYFINDKLVNIKFRGPNKSFKLVSGAELIFWNIDCLKTHIEVIIVEGEIDALTFIQAGYDNVVSVPNGANKNLEYLDNCIEMFNGVSRIFIATDQDTKGIELKTELIRRLGAERCSVVSFKECKDANEFLCKYGADIHDVIPNAAPVPMKGVVEVGSMYADIRDLYENGLQPGKKIGQDYIDELITWETGRLAVVTGVPGMGKSEFVDHMMTKLNLMHGWKAAYFTPENYPLRYHYAKLFEKLISKTFSKSKTNEIEYDMVYEWMKNNIYYIIDEEDFTIDTILAAAKSLVKSRGVKILVIDPYNKLEHKYNDSETQYISRFLDKLVKFAKMNDILVVLVAHPKKMSKDASGKFEVPSLYDISGSANFFNKTDYGLTVHRVSDESSMLTNNVEVYIQKIKYKHLGKTGMIPLEYDYVSGRFHKTGRDQSNWLDDRSRELTLPVYADVEMNFEANQN